MTNKTKVSIFLVIILILGVFYFIKKDDVAVPLPTEELNQNTPLDLTDASFDQTLRYACKDSIYFDVALGDGIARISLLDKRVFTLEKTFEDEGSEIKFSNDGDQITLWIKDSNAFVQEEGKPLYEACRFMSVGE